MDPYGYDEDQAAQIAAAMSAVPLEQERLRARQKRATAMMGAAMPDGRQVGRIYVASSPLEALSSAMSRIQGNRMADQAERDYAPIGDQARQAGAMQFRIQRADKARDYGLKDREAQLAEARAMSAEAEQAASAKAREVQLGESARHNRAVEGLTRGAQEQDAWGYGQDASGGGVLYNKKTGGIVPLSPRGPGVSSPYPGKGHDMEKDVQALGKDLESVGQMRADLSTLDGYVSKGEVPGFGPIAGRVPDLVASNEAISARQAAKRIMASYIQMRSGTAASDKEVERLLAANGLGPTATPEAIRQGVSALRGMAAETVGRIEAKYHPEVVATYKGRGGVNREAFSSHDQAPANVAPEDAQAKAWADANPNDPRAAAIRQRLKAKGL
jgi:hypothetical protein